MADVSKDQAAKIANWLASQGRGGDSLLAHVARGEIVIPNILLDAEDQALRKIIQEIFKEYGVDPDIYTVGTDKNSINPETGLIEFGWLSKTWKKVTKPIKKVVKTITKAVKKVVGTVAKTVGLAPEVPEAPSTGSSSTALGDGTLEDVTSGKQKKSAALRRRARGKRRLRVGNQMSIGTTGTSGVGTGGSTGSSVNVPKG
jgi:hypothetical protein